MNPLLALSAVGPVASTAVSIAKDFHAKARAVSQEFEAIFLNEMLQPMVSAANDGGPLGGGPASSVWRSMLTDEYSKTFAASGGIGIADHIYSSLIAAQEGRSA